jgi:hypothetical protein
MIDYVDVSDSTTEGLKDSIKVFNRRIHSIENTPMAYIHGGEPAARNMIMHLTALRDIYECELDKRTLI